MTPAQSRAARAWLNWTQAELATRARVGIVTIVMFEKGRTCRPAIVAAIEHAFEGKRVDFGIDYHDGAPLGEAWIAARSPL